MFYEEFGYQKNKKFLGLVEMMSGLVSASFSLPKWQAEKIIFFAPCFYTKYEPSIIVNPCMISSPHLVETNLIHYSSWNDAFVNRVYEKIMEKLKELGQQVTGVKRKIGNWAKGVALQGNMNLEQG